MASSAASISSFNSHLSASERKSHEHLSVVVLGASGDLAKRKIFPSLFGLYSSGMLPKNTHIFGYARTMLSDAEFRSKVLPASTKDPKKQIPQFLEMLHYVQGQYDVDADFESLHLRLVEAETGFSSANRLFYLSLPPQVFVSSATGLGKFVRSETGWNRLVVEKPFGRDSDSFRELSIGLLKTWSSRDIFRIDHYLGKEVVQNLSVLRFANVILDPLWNRNFISNIQIIFKEEIGVEGRGGYFDQYGIIRDVMQNHLLQVLALVCMEPPVSLSPDDIRNEKVKVLRSIAPCTIDDLVVGQYKGKSIGGCHHPGYLEDATVSPTSITPTFAACALKIRNRRWDGVPILLKCGKALDGRLAEIRITFNSVPGNLYSSKLTQNELVIRVQPDEAIFFKINNKVPGLAMRLEESILDMSYKSRFSQTNIPDAYERLICDAIAGDESNFIREDELEASWKIFDNVLAKLDSDHIKPDTYPFGSRGPVSHDHLAARHGCKWSED